MADDVIGKLIFQVDTDTTEAKKGIEDFSESMKETQEVAKQTETEVGKASEGISAKGVAIAVAIGTAVLKLGQEVAQATGEIQSGQATIVNATGATGEALSGLMDSAKAVYSDSEESFDEVARAIGEVNTRLGITGESLEETTGRFLDFAGATGQDVQQSVIGVTQAMNRWGIETEELPLLLDKLTVAGQASGISVATLTSNLTANAGTLQAMGYSMDESIAMMMSFEKQGIDSNAVLMAMKKSFEESASAGTDARMDWEALMYSIAYATDETEANSIAIDAFGSRIATDMVSALQSGSLNFDDFADAIANAGGTLEATDEASKTTADRIETLKHSITLMLSEVGEELAPIIEEILPTVKTLIEAVFDAIKPIIPVLGDLVKQVLPPLMEIIIGLVNVLVPIIEKLLPPLASALQLIGTLISAVFTILSPILQIVTDILSIGIGLVSDMLTPILNLLTPIFQIIADAINAVLTPLTTVISGIVGWIEKIINGIKWLVGWLGDGIKALLGLNDAVEETEDELVSFDGNVDKAGKTVSDYSKDLADMSGAIAEGAKAFGDAIPSLDGFSASVDLSTGKVLENKLAVDAETESLDTLGEKTEENGEKTKVSTKYTEEELKSHLENSKAVKKETEEKKENTEETEKNTEEQKKAIEAQREAERLEKERIQTTEQLTNKLIQQGIQTEQNRASELEANGDIEEAYAIRARLLDEELQRELSALRTKIAENKATENDILLLKQYYATQTTKLDAQKNKAIAEQNKKRVEAEKRAEEGLTKKTEDEIKARKKAEEDAEAKRVSNFNASNQLISDALSGLTADIGTTLQNLVHVMTNEFATTEDKVKSLQQATLAFAGLAGNAMFELGKSLASGEVSWKSLGKTALKALASIVRALAEEMTARAVLAGFSLNWVGAGALTAGAVAGFIGAGLIDGYADSLLIGKDYVPYDDYPARLHQGEMVLDRIDAEKFRRYGGMYGVEQMASQPLGMDLGRISPLNINNQLSAVIEVDGTQLGIAVLKNIDNASQFVLR